MNTHNIMRCNEGCASRHSPHWSLTSGLLGSYFSFTPDNTVAYNDDVFDFGIEPIANDKITFVLDTKYLTEDTSTDSQTGISEVYTARPSNVDDGWYTISGYRLNTKPTFKGIYLHQGKKVIIK